MNYPELIKTVSAKSGIRKDDVSLIIDTLRKVMVEKLTVEEEVVSIPEFGKFYISRPKSRKYYSTKERCIKTTVTRRAVFNPSTIIRKFLKENTKSV